MPEHETNPLERGALWQKTGQRGTWFSGTVDGKPCVVFKNPKFKEGSKLPAWIVFAPKPKDQPPPGTHVRDEAVGSNEPVWGEEHRQPVDPDDEDSIPF